MNLIRRGEYHAFAGGDAHFLYLVPSAAVVRIDDVTQAVLDCLETGDRSPVDLTDVARRPLDVRRRQVVDRRAARPSRRVPCRGAAAQADRREAEAPHSAADARAQRHEQVQSVVRILLRVRRGPHRRGDDQAALHERGNRPAERGLHVRRVGRFADGEPDVLRRRDADELQSSQISARLRARTRRARSARKSTRASRRTRRCCAKRSSTGSSRTTSASRCRSTARASSRTSIARSRTAWAATTSSFRTSSSCSRGIAGGRSARASRSRGRISTSSRSTGICSRRSASGKSASRRSRHRGSASTRFRTTASRRCLSGFQTLAAEFLQSALAGRRHGFSNVRDTLEEMHKGMSKAYPCGAGLGLMGVATDGDVALCHRFAGSNTHKLGTVFDGVDHARQDDFLTKHHIANKTDCATCWARPLCAGGCYHEAHTRYGSTVEPNLHYCDWIRSWTNTCLEVYGTLAERAPEFLTQFDR